MPAGLVAAQPVLAQSIPQNTRSSRTPRQEEVIVTEERQEAYRVDQSALSKLTENLRDTPQSIKELTSALLEDRGATSLNDALATVPGITLGAGEFSWQGNNPSIRGFGARDDMYLDGLRDFGSYPRDPFNLETVEVLLGPSSVLFGRGSTGGAINQVSKRPQLTAQNQVNVDLGSDETVRATLDTNLPLARLGNGAALRVNALAHSGEVADRIGAKSKRFGLAPTLALGMGNPTEVTLSYMKQTSDDRPDYGLPWLDGRPAPVARDNFYGFMSDYLKTDADIASGHVLHTVSDTIRVDVQARYADYSRQSRITEPLITPQPAPGTALSDIDVFRYVFIGDSDETLLTGTANATMDFDGGEVGHRLVAGAELSTETSKPVFAFGIGAPGTSLVDPNPDDAFTATSTDPRIRADTKGQTTALYALDTMNVADRWLVTLGLRWDRFDTDYDATRYPGPATPFNTGTESGREQFAQVDEVFSYRTAVIYKPQENASLYLAASNSFNPSAQSLSFLTSGRGLGTGNAFLDPEENRSIEAGYKRDLSNRDAGLSVALFEIDKTNARVPDPNNPGFNTLGGEQRVRGFSFELNGSLTDRLYFTSGYTFLDSEVIKAAPGAEAGAELANAPEHSLSVWTDYLLSTRFDVGFGARYVSEQLAQNTGAGKRVPGYALFDAMLRYRASDRLTMKLNLTNLTNEEYFELLHPWHVVPGPGFTAMLAVDVVY